MDDIDYAVHRNTGLSIYEEAKSGKLRLWYSTKPMVRGSDVSISEFAGEYIVPPNQALELRELILQNMAPDEIVSRLGLERASVGSLEDYVPPEDRRLKLPRRTLIPGGPNGGFREVYRR